MIARVGRSSSSKLGSIDSGCCTYIELKVRTFIYFLAVLGRRFVEIDEIDAQDKDENVDAAARGADRHEGAAR